MSTINPQDIIAQFQKAQDEANAANKARYEQLLQSINSLIGRTSGTYDEVLADTANIGNAARTRVNQDTLKALGQSEQDLITRGLGNTTIRSTARRGIKSDAELAMQNIDEQQAGLRATARENRANADYRTTSLLASAIQGRDDLAPNLSQYADLLRQLGAATDPNQKITAKLGAQSSAIPFADSLRAKLGGGGLSGGGGGGGGGLGGGFTPATGGSGGGAGNTAYVIRNTGTPNNLAPRSPVSYREQSALGGIRRPASYNERVRKFLAQ